MLKIKNIDPKLYSIKDIDIALKITLETAEVNSPSDNILILFLPIFIHLCICDLKFLRILPIFLYSHISQPNCYLLFVMDIGPLWQEITNIGVGSHTPLRLLNFFKFEI